MVKILYNNACSKSRSVLEYLDENGVPFEIIDFIQNPLTEEELRTLVKKLQLPAKDLIRTEEPLYKEHFAGKELNDDDAIQLLLQHPSLMQRPILIKGPVAMIARPIEVARLFIEK